MDSVEIIPLAKEISDDSQMNHEDWLYSLFYLAGNIQRYTNCTGVHKNASFAIACKVRDLQYPFHKVASIKHFPNCSFPLSSQPMTQELWESSKVYLPFFYTKTDYIFFIRVLCMSLLGSRFQPKRIYTRITSIIWWIWWNKNPRQNGIRRWNMRKCSTHIESDAIWSFPEHLPCLWTLV